MSEMNEHLELLMKGVPRAIRERIKAAYWLGCIDCMKDCGLKQVSKIKQGNVVYLTPPKDDPEGN